MSKDMMSKDMMSDDGRTDGSMIHFFLDIFKKKSHEKSTEFLKFESGLSLKTRFLRIETQLVQ